MPSISISAWWAIAILAQALWMGVMYLLSRPIQRYYLRRRQRVPQGVRLAFIAVCGPAGWALNIGDIAKQAIDRRNRRIKKARKEARGE